MTMVKNITVDVYTNVSRGLFERHKLIFSFLISVNINLQEGKITNAQWNFLLHGPVGTTKRDNKKGPVALSEEKWKTVNYMADIFPKFKDLPDHCTNYIEIKLGDFIYSIQLDRENSDTTVNWNSLLNSFEKLMLIKSLSDEKLMIAIVNYVSIELGKSFIESSDVSINSLYKYTTSTMPLIFILSPGSDPFGAFQKFAVEFGMIDKLHVISMGQDQGPKAEKLIKNAKKKGDWIFLQVLPNNILYIYSLKHY
jgi:dynein heavy chain